MLDREFKKRVEDFFEGYELVEFLQIPVEDVVDVFEDVIEENQDEIEEFIYHGTRGRAAKGGDRELC